MKLYFLITLAFLGTIRFGAFAQGDNSAMTADIYQRASQFYEEDKFQECLALLNRAETLNSGTDPKLMYLKIKARNNLYQQDKTQRAELVRDIERFNEIVAKQPYAAEKVREVSLIKQGLASVSIEEKNAKERLEMETLRIKEENKNKYEEQILLLQPDIEKASSKRSTGRLLTTLGVLTSVGYVIYLISSWSELESNDVGVTPTKSQKTKQIIAGTGIMVPIVFFVAGSSTKGKGRSIMKEVEEKKNLLNKQYLSIGPQIQFRQGPLPSQYGLAIRMRF